MHARTLTLFCFNHVKALLSRMSDTAEILARERKIPGAGSRRGSDVALSVDPSRPGLVGLAKLIDELQNTKDIDMKFPLFRTPGHVWRSETHFFFPFMITAAGCGDIDRAEREGKLNGKRVIRPAVEAVPWAWDDSHLLFNNCRLVIPVTVDGKGRWAGRHGVVTGSAADPANPDLRKLPPS